MKQNILGTTPQAYRKTLCRREAVCAAALILTLAMNLLFTLARTEENHAVMLWLNILTDVFCGLFVLAYTSFRILPQRRLYGLMCRQSEVLYGTVQQISEEITRYMDMDCLEIRVDSRRLFLPACSIELVEGEAYTFHIASNVILEVAQ